MGLYPPTKKGVYNEWIITGDEVNPYWYAPNFYIWQGSILQTPEYGTIISDGTKFKHIKNLERNHRIVYQGEIINWKADINTTMNERFINGKWVQQ